MTSTGGVTINEALESEKHCLDCIAEIDALTNRLLKLKKQLQGQKEYIDTAIDKSMDTTTAFTANDVINTGKIVDSRVQQYRHAGGITIHRNNGTNYNDHAIDTNGNSKIRHGKKKGEKIFKTAQLGTGAELTNGHNILEVKKFLIGVNALITATNDVTTEASNATEAIVPTNQKATEDASLSVGKISTNYKPGGIHKTNEEVFKSILGYRTADNLDNTGLSGFTTPDDATHARNKKIRGFNIV